MYGLLNFIELLWAIACDLFLCCLGVFGVMIVAIITGVIIEDNKNDKRE